MARHSKSKYVSRPDGGLLTLGDLPPATIGRSVVRLKKDQSALGSAARLQALIESFSDYIWSVDPDGIYTYVSQGVASLLGYDPQELIGKTPFDIMPPSEAARVADFFRGTAAERRSFDRFENFVLNRNGCKVVLESSGVPVVDEAGVFRGYCGIDRDITARKQTEEKAQRQASQYAAMLAMTADGFGRFDADGWLLEVNDAYCRMSGYSRAELLNLRIQDIDAVEGAGEIAQQIQKVKTTGFGRIDSQHRRKDGSVFDVEVSISWWPEGEQFLHFCRDVSESKRLSKALQQSRERLALATESARMGIWDWDIAADKLAWDARMYALYGIHEEDFSGAYDAWQASLHPEDRAAADAAIKAAIEGMKDFNIEFRALWPNGEVHDIEAHALVQGPSNGSATRMVGVNWDITERNRAQSTLQETLRRTRIQLQAISEIGEAEVGLLDNIEGLARQISEKCAAALGCERVNVWLFNEAQTELTCIDLYEATPAKHSSGMLLQEAAYRPELQAIREGKYVNADDPLTDARTAGYVETYVKPLGITSMLDVLVRTSERDFGLICFEHVAKPHHWEQDEIAFASAMADKIGLALIGKKRREAERKLSFNAVVLATEHDMSPDGILVVDDAERIVSFNRRFEELWKIPPELLETRDDTQVLDYVARQIADHETFMARVKYLYAHREEKGFEHIKLADGRTFDRYTAPMHAENDAYLGRMWSFRDITDRLGEQRALERINRTLKTLSAGVEALVHAASEPELLKKMCRVAVENGGYRLAWIGYAQHDDKKTVIPAGWAGEKLQFETLPTISWDDNAMGNGPTGAAIRTGEPQVNQDVAASRPTMPWHESFLAAGYRSSLSLPLKDKAGTFGALNIYSADAHAFQPDEVKLLVELADNLSYGINSLRDREAREGDAQRLRKSLDATVQAIASTLELRDRYTAGHQRNVARLAVAIARNVGIEETEIEGIYLAGTIHDIGKINIPAEILNKPGKLTPLEYQLIQTHAQSGYDVVKGVEFPWPVAEMILQHHERLDGTGYPRGLTGNAILPGARIIAIADVVEAMTARRPYREALGVEAALAEIERGKGRLYDCAAVEACVKIIRSGAFGLG